MKIKALIWNTHRKNVLKCSNISMKKYQNKPTLGVKSVTIKLDTRERNITKTLYTKLKPSSQYFWLVPCWDQKCTYNDLDARHNASHCRNKNFFIAACNLHGLGRDMTQGKNCEQALEYPVDYMLQPLT